MACPSCGTHLLHKRAGELHCCGCGQPRQDLAASLKLRNLLRHTPILLSVLLVLPLALSVASLERMRSNTELKTREADLHQRE
jgi:hypothetical protein